MYKNIFMIMFIEALFVMVKCWNHPAVTDRWMQLDHGTARQWNSMQLIGVHQLE